MNAGNGEAANTEREKLGVVSGGLQVALRENKWRLQSDERRHSVRCSVAAPLPFPAFPLAPDTLGVVTSLHIQPSSCRISGSRRLLEQS